MRYRIVVLVTVFLSVLPLSAAATSSSCPPSLRTAALDVDGLTRGINAVGWYGLGATPVGSDLSTTLRDVEDAGLEATPLSGLATGGTDLTHWVDTAC